MSLDCLLLYKETKNDITKAPLPSHIQPRMLVNFDAAQNRLSNCLIAMHAGKHVGQNRSQFALNYVMFALICVVGA